MLLQNILKDFTSEQVKVLIECSNWFFVLLILLIGRITYLKYKEIEEIISFFNQIHNGFNSENGRILSIKKNEDYIEEYWFSKISNPLNLFKKYEEDGCKERLINFQSTLNEAFAPVALKLKEANSWFEGLASIGLLGTVCGLLIGAMYPSSNSNLDVLISSFSTALITTFLGLLCQLIIRLTKVDVNAENAVEAFQGKILQLVELSKENPNKLSDEFLDKFTSKQENNSEKKPNNKEA